MRVETKNRDEREMRQKRCDNAEERERKTGNKGILEETKHTLI